MTVNIFPPKRTPLPAFSLPVCRLLLVGASLLAVGVLCGTSTAFGEGDCMGPFLRGNPEVRLFLAPCANPVASDETEAPAVNQPEISEEDKSTLSRNSRFDDDQNR